MKTDDFDYELPEALIAQHPPEHRADSRLLVVDEAGYHDRRFTDLPHFLRPDDVLVVNNTRVIPARLMLRKSSGGRVEVMLERFTDTHELLALARSNKPLKPGVRLYLGDREVLELIAREAAFFRFRVLDAVDGAALFRTHGQMPLPPYIDRQPEHDDVERYQTVYAQTPGAVAAPTAGLHFDDAILQRVQQMGVERVALTLHVGAGTFQPVKVDAIGDHEMHHERYAIDAPTAEVINRAKRNGRRVVAVGTTTVRALESAARDIDALASGAKGAVIQPGDAETRLFITPGFEFQVVDAMLTNFHLPRSTLLMMIAAFAGRERVLSAYQHAIHEQYRFFSYGDAMWLTRQPG